MDEENLVYEIQRKIQESNGFQKDMEDAKILVQNLFKERYLDKMQDVLISKQSLAKNNPSKEIQLMNVLKSFAPRENHEMINKMSDFFLLMSTVQNIQNDLRAYSTQNVNEKNDDVLHTDGVYEVDNQCMSDLKGNKNIAPFIIMMALFGV